MKNAFENDSYGKQESRFRHAILCKNHLGEASCHVTLAASEAKCLARMKKEGALSENAKVYNIECDPGIQKQGEESIRNLVGSSFVKTFEGRLLAGKTRFSVKKKIDSMFLDLCGHFTEIPYVLAENRESFGKVVVLSITVTKKRAKNNGKVWGYGQIHASEMGWSNCSSTKKARKIAEMTATNIFADLHFSFENYNIQYLGAMNYEGGMMNISFLLTRNYFLKNRKPVSHHPSKKTSEFSSVAEAYDLSGFPKLRGKNYKDLSGATLATFNRRVNKIHAQYGGDKESIKNKLKASL